MNEEILIVEPNQVEEEEENTHMPKRANHQKH